MNELPAKKSLLNDVMREGEYAGFRELLKSQVAAEAGRAGARRKRRKRRRVWLALAAMIAGAAVLLTQKNSEIVIDSQQPKATTVVSPAPESAERQRVVEIFRTEATSERIKLSRANAVDISFRTRSAGTNFVIWTDHSQSMPSISDAELLALFPNRATALYQRGGEKHFMFLEPKDAAELLRAN